MGTYNLPRSVKGEGRILFVFTGKSMIYTVVAGTFGLIFYFIFSLFDLRMVGLIITAVFALMGFVIGTIKMPNIAKLKQVIDDYVDGKDASIKIVMLQDFADELGNILELVNNDVKVKEKESLMVEGQNLVQ